MVLALPLKSFPSAFLSPKLGNTFDNTKLILYILSKFQLLVSALSTFHKVEVKRLGAVTAI